MSNAEPLPLPGWQIFMVERESVGKPTSSHALRGVATHEQENLFGGLIAQETPFLRLAVVDLNGLLVICWIDPIHELEIARRVQRRPFA